MKAKVFILFLLGTSLMAPAFAQAPEYLKELGLMVAYGHTGLHDKKDYVVIPVSARFGVNMDKMELGFCDWVEKAAKAWFNKDYRPAGDTEFLLEAFASYVAGPNHNAEIGLVPMIKFSYPITEKIHPYAFAGGGIMFITQHLREQSTQYNFTPQIGGGISYFFKPDWAFNVDYRWRHFSNAQIKKPNDGVNIGLISIGVSRFFE